MKNTRFLIKKRSGMICTAVYKYFSNFYFGTVPTFGFRISNVDNFGSYNISLSGVIIHRTSEVGKF